MSAKKGRFNGPTYKLHWTLRWFQMFIHIVFHIKLYLQSIVLHLLSTVLLSWFQSSSCKAAPGKFYGSSGHSKCKSFHVLANFDCSKACQIILILTNHTFPDAREAAWRYVLRRNINIFFTKLRSLYSFPSTNFTTNFHIHYRRRYWGNAMLIYPSYRICLYVSMNTWVTDNSHW